MMVLCSKTGGLLHQLGAGKGFVAKLRLRAVPKVSKEVSLGDVTNGIRDFVR
jgi:hypothetical protein